jgi:hypothetical protein
LDVASASGNVKAVPLPSSLYRIVSLRQQTAPAIFFWEVIENTPFVVRSYAVSTQITGYTGDSVINSAGDMMATMLGFFAASFLPIWSPALVVFALNFLPHDRPWYLVQFFIDH